jgi:hypothetical protein
MVSLQLVVYNDKSFQFPIALPPLFALKHAMKTLTFRELQTAIYFILLNYLNAYLLTTYAKVLHAAFRI